MVDRIGKETRSNLMARIKRANTRPERMLRSALWVAGLRYRLCPSLPGKPDLAFPGACVAVFVDGCFWHGCAVHGHTPKTNREYWVPKLLRNWKRDRAANSALLSLGWLPVRIWEHAIYEDLAGCVDRIGKVVRLRA